MEHYAGLDISMEETSVCILDKNGNIVREGAVPTEPEAITAFLEDFRDSLRRAGLEAGALTPWLCQELLAADIPAICIETRHAKAAMQAQNVKTDRNDARGIAHMMRTGWFRAVHVKSTQSQKLRVLLGNRRCLLDKRLDIERRIRGTLKAFGLKVGKVGAAGYETRVRELIDGDAELTAWLEPLLQARRHLIEQFKVLEKTILDYVKNDDVCRRLMTIPGVGPLTALAFKTSIDRPERFAKAASVGAALGLTPRKYASGQIDYDGRITKCGDALARTHLYEAAKVLLSRVTKWSAIKVWGLNIARRSSMKNACVAVARKLALVMHRIWVDGTEFHWGKEPAAVTA
jgi:transposase